MCAHCFHKPRPPFGTLAHRHWVTEKAKVYFKCDMAMMWREIRQDRQRKARLKAQRADGFKVERGQ